MAKKSSVVTYNPTFDSRMLSIGSPNLSDPTTGRQIPNKLRRGWIVTDRQAAQASGLTPGRVNFLYNPPQVSVSHSANVTATSTDAVAAAQQTGLSAEEGMYALAPLGTMSFSLLFDRTYELWDRQYAGSIVGNYGVYADVLAFYKLFGMVASNTQSLIGPIRPGSERPEITNFNLFPSVYMAYPVVYVYLGANGMKFHGAVVSLGISYTHWTKNMIPSRAEVDITLNLTPGPEQSKVNGKGGTVVSPHAGKN